MNWWMSLVIVLPLVISWKTMEIGLPRLLLLSAFLLVFLVTFHFCRGSRLEVRPLRPLTRALAGFSVIFFLLLIASSFMAANKQESLYAVIRYLMLGLPTILFALTVTREEDHLSRLCQAIALVLLIHSAIAILQVYHLALTEIPPPASGKPHGFMGNRNLLGSFLVLLFPFCAYLVYIGERKWKIAGGLILWLGTYATVLSQTRGAWVALGAAVVISNIFVFSLRRRFSPSLLGNWLKGMALFVVGTAAAVWLAIAIPNQEGLTESLATRSFSLVRPQEAQSENSVGRLLFWRESLAMLKDHPFLGVGPGNWRVVVQRYGFYKDFDKGNGLSAPDRAHSVYLQTGAEMGIPGFLTFFGIWFTAILLGARVILESKGDHRRMFGITSLACICTYAVNSIFNFPNECYAHSLVVALALGAAVGMYETTPRREPAPPALALNRAWLIAPAVFLSFCVYFGLVKAGFEHHARRAIGYQNLKNYELMLAEVAAGCQPLVTLAPRGFPLEIFGVSAYANLRRFDEALSMARRARMLNPWSVQILNQTGEVYSQMGRWDDALQCYQEALRLSPTSDIALKNAGTALYAKGLFKESCDTFLRSRYLDSETTVQRLGLAYLKLGDYEKAALIWREGLPRFPNSVTILENLAFVEYTHLKDLTNAYVHFQRLLTLAPNHPKHDEYAKVVQYLSRTVFPSPSALTNGTGVGK
jgi:O-antigen ligase/tetratricopeptide (TPR) repeat protein